MVRTHNAQLPLEQVLDLGAFDLERALKRDAAFLQPQRPYEWAGAYRLSTGIHLVHTGAAAHESGHGHEHEHAQEQAHGHGLKEVGVVLLRADEAVGDAIEALQEQAALIFAEPGARTAPGAKLPPARHLRLELAEHADFSWEVSDGGVWVAFCEHAPGEFGWSLSTAVMAERSFGSHHHEGSITSVGISDARALHPDKVNEWLSYLLQTRGQDILRMKGVLSFRDEPRRYVFHGVHMVFDGQLERPWGDERADQPAGVYRTKS